MILPKVQPFPGGFYLLFICSCCSDNNCCLIHVTRFVSPAASRLKVTFFLRMHEHTSSVSSALLQTWTNARATPTTVTPPRSASTRPAATPAPAPRATGSSPDSVRVGRDAVRQNPPPPAPVYIRFQVSECRRSSRNYLNTGVGPEKVPVKRRREEV